MKQDLQKQGVVSLFLGTTLESRVCAEAMDNCKHKNIEVQTIKAFNPVHAQLSKPLSLLLQTHCRGGAESPASC